ncbi:PIG-L family deacetylase [Saccharopolyspora sp. NFXS83]|uniref:PIG-L family deacetylase n=1 Tax=Saccharopolyspora sp. NFXS83 TaxID=2993560 RepID=UPI00224B1522|nr:PIG-L family deacetylase [Saccharopolyspora sp. NFXS83]MCX2733022.1 PIG-L family deacetylase [Saccharopolyspora sp. NFXS83]
MRGSWRASVLAVTACVPLSFAPTPGAADTGGARYVQVVAHPDDDILFMNPDLRTAVRSGAPVTTVYLTAGESDVRPAEPYAAGRQAGSRAAFAEMAAAPDEWERSATEVLPGRFAEVHALRTRPAIRLVFLNLPDDNDPLAAGGKHALSRLWAGGGPVRTVVPEGAPLPGPSEYGRDQLIGALAELLRRYDPTVLRTQDPLPDPRYQAHWDGHDHPDHVATTRFATAAAARHDGPVRVVHYRGYNVADAAPNLSPDVVETKRRIFARYAPHDPMVGLGEPYGTWLRSMRYRWPASGHRVERDDRGRLHFADVRGGRLLLGERDGSRIEPVPLPAPPVGSGDVAFLRGGDGLRVVVRDFRTGASYSTSQDAGGRWRPRWRTVAPPGDGAALGNMATSSTADGRLVVARSDARSGVNVRIGDGPWIRLHAEDVGDVAVVRGRGGVVHVFAATPDGMTHWESAGDEFVSAPVPPGLRPAGPIGATAAADGTALLAFRQADDGALVVLAEPDEPARGWRVRARLRSSGGGSGPALAAASATSLVLAVRTGLGGTEVFRLSPRGVHRTVLRGSVADRPSLSADGTLAATADDGALLVSEPGPDGAYRRWERLAAPVPAGRPRRDGRTCRGGGVGGCRLRGRPRLANTAQPGRTARENTNINVKDAREAVNGAAGGVGWAS